MSCSNFVLMITVLALELLFTKWDKVSLPTLSTPNVHLFSILLASRVASCDMPSRTVPHPHSHHQHLTELEPQYVTVRIEMLTRKTQKTYRALQGKSENAFRPDSRNPALGEDNPSRTFQLRIVKAWMKRRSLKYKRFANAVFQEIERVKFKFKTAMNFYLARAFSLQTSSIDRFSVRIRN